MFDLIYIFRSKREHTKKNKKNPINDYQNTGWFYLYLPTTAIKLITIVYYH